jgi:hypothetical protein
MNDAPSSHSVLSPTPTPRGRSRPTSLSGSRLRSSRQDAALWHQGGGARGQLGPFCPDAARARTARAYATAAAGFARVVRGEAKRGKALRLGTHGAADRAAPAAVGGQAA